jgi:phosphate ABC transporter phosphate-binding protein
MLTRVYFAILSLALFTILITGCNSGSPSDVDSGGAKTSEKGKSVPVELEGAGATFVEPIMKFWVRVYEEEKTGGKVKINYQGKGSGAGIASMTKKEVAFGCSDAPMNSKQLEEVKQKGGEVVHIPLVIGAVIPMYNLPGVAEPIKFTGPVLAEIFTGKITKWNDGKLTALNPDAKLPDLAIQPVYRLDPSGTSFMFSDYLSKVDPEFKKTVGASTTPNWPATVGIRQQKSDGVANHIDKNPGSIGYIELTFALDKKAKFGSVRNKAGKDILANLDSISAAGAASLDKVQTEEPYSLHQLTYNLTNADGDNSYPIAGMTFGVVYQKLEGDKAGGDKGRATVEFLRWVTSAEGQELARKRNYAPLPLVLQETIKARLDTVPVP